MTTISPTPLDLTGDNGDSPGVSDYFWFTFDVDRNRAITPRVDINYSIFPTLPLNQPSTDSGCLPIHRRVIPLQGANFSGEAGSVMCPRLRWCRSRRPRPHFSL